MSARQDEYRRYLQSAAWQATRERRLAVAGHQCEFAPVTGYYKADPLHGPRCTEVADLQVHHLHYGSLGHEKDNELEVLCRFHHLVRHVLAIECYYCGDDVVTDDDEAIEIVQQAIAECSGIEKTDLEYIKMLLTSTEHSDDGKTLVCDYHAHMLTKDD